MHHFWLPKIFIHEKLKHVNSDGNTRTHAHACTHALGPHSQKTRPVGRDRKFEKREKERERERERGGGGRERKRDQDYNYRRLEIN